MNPETFHHFDQELDTQDFRIAHNFYDLVLRKEKGAYHVFPQNEAPRGVSGRQPISYDTVEEALLDMIQSSGFFSDKDY